MKQILQNLRNGETSLEDIPVPKLIEGHILINSQCSLVSKGTEKMLIDFGNANLLQKALSQPDKVKQVIKKLRTEGFRNTITSVFNKLDEPIQLGYCNVGTVVDVGSEVEIIFEQTGRVDVVLTVFDQSGNTDSHPFSVNVAVESEPTSIFGILVVTLFIGVITMAVSMIGYRRWQGKIALELLTGRGLSESEAKAHIRMVSQKMKVPIFASASVIAGLDINQPVESSEEKAERAKQAQYDSIYGSNQQDPNAGFAPQNNTFQPVVRQVSQGSQAAAADALAMFAEDETETIIESRNTQQPEKVVETKVNSGGIELPQNIKTKISAPPQEIIQEPKKVIDASRNISCPECNHQFMIKVPQGVDQAVVECPACNTDFGIEFA